MIKSLNRKGIRGPKFPIYYLNFEPSNIHTCIPYMYLSDVSYTNIGLVFSSSTHYKIYEGNKQLTYSFNLFGSIRLFQVFHFYLVCWLVSSLFMCDHISLVFQDNNRELGRIRDEINGINSIIV